MTKQIEIIRKTRTFLLENLKDLTAEQLKHHYPKKLDESKIHSEIPLIQVQIIDYSSESLKPSVVLFGWTAQWSGRDTPVFKSDDLGVVRYFGGYFDKLYTDFSVDIENLDTTLPTPSRSTLWQWFSRKSLTP